VTENGGARLTGSDVGSDCSGEHTCVVQGRAALGYRPHSGPCVSLLHGCGGPPAAAERTSSLSVVSE
jgi:hypothetical protein